MQRAPTTSRDSPAARRAARHTLHPHNPAPCTPHPTAVNVDALADYLRERRTQGNLYMVRWARCASLCLLCCARCVLADLPSRALAPASRSSLSPALPPPSALPPHPTMAHRPKQGCMKSGEVLVDKRWKWFEPEHWRFGDPAGKDDKINYMRHASGGWVQGRQGRVQGRGSSSDISAEVCGQPRACMEAPPPPPRPPRCPAGQIYGLSRPVARFIAQNEAILHRYANEDVSVSLAWPACSAYSACSATLPAFSLAVALGCRSRLAACPARRTHRTTLPPLPHVPAHRWARGW